MHTTHPEARTILIVERDRVVRELQAHFLAEAGFEVEFVDDGQAALDRVAVSLPSLIVTEIMIPKVDGLTLCRRLRDDPRTRDVPIVVFSILAAAARADDAGASAYLRKPLIESVFVTTIQDVIAAQSNEKKEQQWVSQ